MARQTRADEGGRPWVIQPELVTGCSMRHGTGSGGLCHFCGLQAIRNGPGGYEYMDFNTACRIADQMAAFCPNARVEFAMRGEPLMHPQAISIVAMFRSTLPKTSLMLTTNGDTLRGPHIQERVDRLFNAGLNVLLLDTYYPKERRDELQAQAFALTGVEVVDFYRDWAGTGESPYSRHGKSRIVVVMDDLAARDGEHSSRQVKNHAGANPTKSTVYRSHSCGRPFREMVVHSNGNVPLCCDDWRQEYVIGNVHTSTFEDLWKHPRYEAMRAFLYQKQRTAVCAGCDAPPAPRFGLLPVYEPPTEQDVKIASETYNPKNPLWRK